MLKPLKRQKCRRQNLLSVKLKKKEKYKKMSKVYHIENSKTTGQTETENCRFENIALFHCMNFRKHLTYHLKGACHAPLKL